MAFEITGKVSFVGETVEVSDKFKKRAFVIEYAENPAYPEYIQIEANQDKCALLDELREGDTVTVHFNLRGRPWTNKEGVTSYFNTLAMWKFNLDKTVPNNAPATSAPDEEEPPF